MKAIRKELGDAEGGGGGGSEIDQLRAKLDAAKLPANVTRKPPASWAGWTRSPAPPPSTA